MTSLLSRRGLMALSGGLAAFPAAAQPSLGARRSPGANLYEIAASTRGNTVYVAAAGAACGGPGPRPEIAILDGATLATRGAIALEVPAFGLALNETTQTLFTTNTIEGSVSVIDLASGRVTARAKAGEGSPHLRQVAVDETTNTAYASVFGYREHPSAIWAVDGRTGTIARQMTEGLAEGGLTGLAIDAPRRRLFATALSTNEVVEVDLASGRAVRRFAAGGEGAVNVAIDAEGQRLFVTLQRTGAQAVLNATTGEVIRLVQTGAGALGVTHDAARKRLYVANRGAGTVSVLDATSLAILASVETGTHPNTVAVNRETGLAYASSKRRTGPRDQPPPEDPNGDMVAIIRT